MTTFIESTTTTARRGFTPNAIELLAPGFGRATCHAI
jgi:hypothetical protein